MKRLVMLFTVTSVAFGVYAEKVSTNKWSQADVDRVVIDEIIAFEHAEDADDVEAWVVKQGATKSMLSHAYLRALEKLNNSPMRSTESQMFHSAIWGFADVASEEEFVKLLPLATSSSNHHDVCDIVRAYSLRVPKSRELIKWCVRKGVEKSCDGNVRGEICDCYGRALCKKDLDEDLRQMILEALYPMLQFDSSDVSGADTILAVHDPKYKKSAIRREALMRVLQLEKDEKDDYLRKQFERKLREVDEL